MSLLPLENIRIIDFCWVGAGSYMTRLLADLGADVIKVESTQSVDSLRLAAPFAKGLPGVNRSGYFADRNSSKQSITLNMKDPRGVAIAHELVAGADIVTNNFRPGTMEKLGVGYEDLRLTNPGIIYIGMSMCGDEGPSRLMLGYGITMAAMTGFLGLSGYPDREPTGTGTNFPDHVPNPTHGAFAVMAALRHRRLTGQGQKIDLAQTEPMLALMPVPVMQYQVNRRCVKRMGNRAPGCAPRGVYPTLGQDRWIAITIRTDQHWSALVDALDDASLGKPHWALAMDREADAEAIDALISSATAKFDGYELLETLQAAGVMAGVVQNAADLVDRDPQLRHRKHWRYLPHVEMGETLYNAPPFKFESHDVGPRSAAPLLGEHTHQILQMRLNKSEQEIRELEDQQVLI